MQYTVKSKAVRHETSFVIVVTSAVSHFPVLGGLQTRTDSRRMSHAVLKQVTSHTSAAKAVTVVKAERPPEHFVLAHLRRQTAIKIATPIKAFRKIVAPVREFWNLHLIWILGELMVNTVTRIDSKKIIGQNLETERGRNVRELQGIGGKVIGHIMASRQKTPGAVLVFYRAALFALGRIGSMAHHLQVLDIKVVVESETHRFLLDLVRSLSQ